MAEFSLTEFSRSSTSIDNRLENSVYSALFDKIRFGTYELGQRLPTEAELSEEYSVSRPVVRAALAKLRDSGLIVSRQGAGSFVSSGVPTTAGGFTPLNSISDIAAYFAFRRTIESSCVELAARRAGENDVANLMDLIDDMSNRLNRDEETVLIDIKFHKTIADLSDNRFLTETIEMLHPHWVFVGNFVRSLGMTGQRKGKRMTAEHVAIVDAIAKGDPEAAVKAMNLHIDGSERRVFKGEP